MQLPETFHGNYDALLPQLRQAWGVPEREQRVFAWLRDRTPSEWAKLDEMARSSHWHDLPRQSPQNTNLESAFASFSRSAKDRLAATQRLATLPSAEALPFLLLRCDDWISEIRLLAEQSVSDLLRHEPSAMSRSLPLIITRRIRTRSQRFFDELLSAVPEHQVFDLLTSQHRETARWAWSQILKRNPPPEVLWQLLSLVRDPVIFSGMARQLLAVEGAPAAVRLARARPITLQQLGWRQLAREPHVPLDGLPLARALLHGNSALRNNAQLAAKARNVDLHAFYANAPGTAPWQRARRLAGLSECGAPQALRVATDALNDPDASVRAVALHIYAHQGPASHALLQERLLSETGAALRAVIATVVAQKITVPLTARAQLSHGTPQQRLAAWKLTRTLSGWHRLHATLLLRDEPDPALARSVHGDIAQWLKTQYPRAGLPPADVRDYLVSEFAKPDARLPGARLLRFALGLPT